MVESFAAAIPQDVPGDRQLQPQVPDVAEPDLRTRPEHEREPRTRFESTLRIPPLNKPGATGARAAAASFPSSAGSVSPTVTSMLLDDSQSLGSELLRGLEILRMTRPKDETI